MAKKNRLEIFWIQKYEHNLKANSIAVYFYLVHIAEKRRSKSFPLSDIEIGKNLSLSIKTVKIARDFLIKSKLIDVNLKRGAAAEYLLLDSDESDIKIKQELFSEEKSVEPILNIPSIKEFLDYASSLDNYDESLKKLLKEKYMHWKKAGWKNTQGRPITDYQATIKSTLPFLKTSLNSVFKIPKINHPKK